MDQREDKVIEVVAALIIRDGRVLICQRSSSAEFPLKWEFPGGKVEAGENDAEALRRELREELAIEVQESREIWRHVHLYPEMPGVALRFYQVVKYRGEISNIVFEQVRWAHPQDLTRYDFLEGDWPFIRAMMAANWDVLGS